MQVRHSMVLALLINMVCCTDRVCIAVAGPEMRKAFDLNQAEMGWGVQHLQPVQFSRANAVGCSGRSARCPWDCQLRYRRLVGIHRAHSGCLELFPFWRSDSPSAHWRQPSPRQLRRHLAAGSQSMSARPLSERTWEAGGWEALLRRQSQVTYWFGTTGGCHLLCSEHSDCCGRLPGIGIGQTNIPR